MSEVKPFKCIEEQIDILESRGLVIPDKDKARQIPYAGIIIID